MQNIKAGDFILEIGSGDNPNFHSHVLVDKFFEPTPHRKNTPMKIDHRPIIVGDAERLPFKDKAFDYVICSHIIEHIPNVEAAFKELMRVSKAGYIETPSVYAENIVGKHDIHLWNIFFDGKTFFLNRKTPENISRYVNPDVYDFLFADIFWEYVEMFYVRYEWSGMIHYQIISDDEMATKYRQYEQFITSPVIRNDTYDPKRLRQVIFMLKREIFNLFAAKFPSLAQNYLKKRKEKPLLEWKRISHFNESNIHDKTESVLACPSCHASLIRKTNSYFCKDCSRDYEIKNNIPVFL